jgi:hypothetical protein
VASAPVEALVRLLSHPWGFDPVFQVCCLANKFCDTQKTNDDNNNNNSNNSW